jgi:hypothetical protein
MMAKSNIRFHAWWFDLLSVKVFCYSQESNEFEILKLPSGNGNTL